MTSTTPLLLARGEWERLRGGGGGGGGGGAGGGDAEAAAARTRHVRRLDDASAAMTRLWPNSLENMNRRHEEERAARAQLAKDSDERFYAEYVRVRRAERTRMLSRARDRLFHDQSAPKTILRAVIECATLKERNLQVDFQKQIEHEKNELKRENDSDILGRAKRFHEDNKKRARNRFLANKKHQQVLTSQIRERAERARLEREEVLRLEQIDNEESQKQRAEIQRFEDNFKMSERARIKADMEVASQEVAQRRREEIEREAMEEELNEKHKHYQHVVDCRRKQTEKELLEEKRLMQEKICAKLVTGSAARDAREKEIRDEAERELREREDARTRADKLKAEMYIKDRHKQRRNFLEDQERRDHEQSTMKSWSMLNRCKNTELTKELERVHRQLDWQSKLAYREQLLKQWAERDKRKEDEFKARRYYYGELAERRLREEDSRLLRHAERLRQEARAHARPTAPLDRAIKEYCRKNNLFPAMPLPASQQEHFRGYATVDRSKPEADSEPTCKPLATAAGSLNSTT